MLKLRQVTAIIAILCCGNIVTSADRAEPAATGGGAWPGAAVGLKLGTLGPGGDLTVGLGRYANVRAGGSYLGFSMNRSIKDIAYRLNFDLASFPLLLDVHPFANNFRISGGMVFHGPARVELTSTPTRSITIGDRKYSPEIIGELSGSIKAGRSVAPYFGIGFGNAVAPDTRWSFVFDLGIIAQTYNVELSATGPGMLFPSFLENLAREEQKIQDDVDSFRIYPVLAFGMAYHF